MAKKNAGIKRVDGIGTFLWKYIGIWYFCAVLAVFVATPYLRKGLIRLFVLIVGTIVLISVLVALHKAWLFVFNDAPLSYDELETLAKKRAKHYFETSTRINRRIIVNKSDDEIAAMSLNRWYNIDKNLESFLASVSILFARNKNSQVVYGIEKEGSVRSIWIGASEIDCNEQNNSDFKETLYRCKAMNGYTILEVRNGESSFWTQYLQGVKSSRLRAKVVTQEGVNWMSILCNQNKYLIQFQKISRKFRLEGNDVPDLVDKISISAGKDYFLRKEVYRFHFPKISIPQIIVLILVGMVLCIILGGIS